VGKRSTGSTGHLRTVQSGSSLPEPPMPTLRVAVLATLALCACGPESTSKIELQGDVGTVRPPPKLQPVAGTLTMHLSAAAAVARDGKVMVVGGLLDPWPSDGNGTNCTGAIQEFDPATGTLTQVGQMPNTIRGEVLFSVPGGDLISAMGYCGSSNQEDTMWAVRVGNSSNLGTIPVGAFYSAGAMLESADGGTVLMFAGGYGSGPERDAIQAFDVNSGTGRQLSVTLPQPRPMGAGAASDNAMYVFGGSSTGTPAAFRATNPFTDDIIKITLVPESATVVAKLPEPLAGGCAVTLSDGTINVFGGAHYAVQADGGLALEPTDGIVTFDPKSGEVGYSSEKLPAPAAGLACAVTPDDRVFLFGGAGAGGTPLDAMLEFDSSNYLENKAREEASVPPAALRLAVGPTCNAAGGAPLMWLLLVLLRRRRR